MKRTTKQELLKQISLVDDLYCKLVTELYRLEAVCVHANMKPNQGIARIAGHSWSAFSDTFKSQLIEIDPIVESGVRTPEKGA